MKVVAVIPVKSTSSRIESKNIKILANKPLFIHTLEKVLDIKELDEVWIDTDDINIINTAKEYGLQNFKYFIRDKKYADNNTDGNILLENEINNINADIYLQILVTSPFTKKNTIKNIIKLMIENNCKSIAGCFKENFYLWDNKGPLYNTHKIPNSNDLDKTIIESMSIYATTKDNFIKTKKRVSEDTIPYFLENEEKIDINNIDDFILANKIAIYNKYEEQQQFNNLKIKLNSSIISDILTDLGIKNRIIKNFNLNLQNKKIFGRVKPIQIREKHQNENFKDIYKCLNSYETISHGDIIFVNNPLKQKAYFGDLNATIAITKGCQGTIINGYTRDLDRVNKLDYPILYKNNTCDDVKYNAVLDFYDKPIVVDDITIYVNDLLFADIDGIIIIPRNVEQKVLELCKKTIITESNISNSILLGINIKEILQNFGSF
ncbi:putative bifunctional N-acylneuraminate cytidylyltransferase/demethylmenaquinone methyltransferase [Cafeteria roenbergensis virus]|uniref:Putative bifunctional N-acylneuraminate cytidylyltransferase/demethylmenaquinone methyltransferase n=1 Tax=Cafeteria roenbergensis virus (strain BV-PW1) TaxID=693272 RepID=E3T536_CROVB|nr:putative bifunctional N-acylneuraminate cytidylyltransferase/demethylmenaquinone methyltransferase [Cafeteria roenbergensis virus BV-PW1]ADO67299.1 putative bifunctional N-acylneuraminate cytidylyltransferase/demethylmenaquinone methyltransferase [Cafeteria roenbergensis virus BV-PW1]